MKKSIQETRLEGTIVQLKMEHKEVIDKLEKTIREQAEQISKLKISLEEYEKEFLYNKTDKEVVKKILSLYAKGDAYSTISEKLKYNRMEADIETIKAICQNVEDLDAEMVYFYKEQVELYEKSIKINPDVLKDSMFQYYKMLANEAALDMTKVTDIEERRKLREEMNKHLDKLNGVLKNIVEDKNLTKDKSMEILENKMEEYNNNLNEMMKFNFSAKDILTTDTIN